VNFIVDSSDFEPNDLKKTGLCAVDNEDVNIEPGEGEEFLLVNRNEAPEGITVTVMAPGMNRFPVAWHKNPDMEELSFPKNFCGESVSLPADVSYSDRVKSEARRFDRRSCAPTRVLYMAKKKLELACMSNINVCLRKSKQGNVSAGQVIDPNFVGSLKHDDGFRVLANIRSSPSYWAEKKAILIRQCSQLGKPHFFLTS